ncbi:peptidoglycan-binding protein [Actinomadura sp. 9N407]|uniref:peptidoglycan-binding protein n=1 Tax=Actinomadura sp. 9N407 TaxID=3375154 RepID=UPI0037A61C24
MRRLVAGGVAAVALAAAVAGLAVRTGEGGAAAATSLKGATAAITRGDLVDTKSVDGSLTFAGERGIAATAAGVVTSLPAPGRVLRLGAALYRVDRRPVVLLYGKVPLYRPLRQGMSAGPDVTQLERALRSLGYGDGVTVDRTFTAATARAVREWQDGAGLPETGTVDASQVAFLPGRVRITEVKTAVGDRIGQGRRVLTVTSTERLVHVDLKVSDQGLVDEGGRVTVEVPGGGTVPGRITSVGTVAEKPAGEESGEPTIDVEIELTGKPGPGMLDRAPVTVTLERERRRNVLTVPVEALLALREGGHGVEVTSSDGTLRVVPVRTGAYGSGRVEISGTGLREGMKVGVPSL